MCYKSNDIIFYVPFCICNFYRALFTLLFTILLRLNEICRGSISCLILTTIENQPLFFEKLRKSKFMKKINVYNICFNYTICYTYLVSNIEFQIDRYMPFLNQIELTFPNHWLTLIL